MSSAKTLACDYLCDRSCLPPRDMTTIDATRSSCRAVADGTYSSRGELAHLYINTCRDSGILVTTHDGSPLLFVRFPGFLMDSVNDEKNENEKVERRTLTRPRFQIMVHLSGTARLERSKLPAWGQFSTA